MQFSENPVQENKEVGMALESGAKLRLPAELEWLLPELVQLLTDEAANIHKALEQRDFQTACHYLPLCKRSSRNVWF